jgi:modification methylase
LSGRSEGSVLAPDSLDEYVPERLRNLANPQTALPQIAKDEEAIRAIEDSVHRLPTSHDLHQRDARDMSPILDESVHLVVTSPPYWTLKEYNRHSGQLGAIADYEAFLEQLDRVWTECYRVLVPGGRVVCVVGDVLLSRRRNRGRHTVVPLHSSIQERCRSIGFDNLAPIIWAKIGNASYEASRGGFLGKPFEPNAIIKNDIEYILFQRKHGAYRSPSISARVLSVISARNHQSWFQQIWTGLAGASTKDHPAPFPSELAERLIRMFSFVGDTVLDPFSGTGTTSIAAAKWGRNSIAIEIDGEYTGMIADRMRRYEGNMFASARLNTFDLD